MGTHAANTQHKKKKTPLQKALRIIIALLLILIAMGIIGNFLPKNTGHGAMGAVRPVNVGALLKGSAPSWTVAEHIVAVVRPDNGGKSVMLVNSGHGTASAIIPLAKVGIASQTVTVRNVWAGTVSSDVRALRVVLAPGTAMYLILK